MRLAFALALSFVGLLGCSSEEATAAVDSGPNKCEAAGYVCERNSPFLCRPGFESAKGEAATACGSVDGFAIPCCHMAVDVDTGVDTGRIDTGAGDAATDGTTEASTDATTDAATDATDATSTDAVADG
ncbi:MAG: hypothetical protein IPJ34_21495 [Myxococcales bacterium]|nr:hypothetical protein [Myxococcales bacterium]